MNMKPLQRLLKYLNEEIYPKMSKKDVKEIKSKHLGGELLHEIDLYKNSCIEESLKKNKIKKASVNNWDADKVYPKGRGSVID